MRPFTLDRLEQMHRSLRGRAVVRHDVDVSLPAALDMAVWENKREIHSRFYLMSTSPFYTWEQAQEAAGELRGLGHQVGYHWDTRYPWPAELPVDGSMLVSFHCPEPNLLWRDYKAFDSAYAAEWQGRYYADSRGRFRHGDPEDHVGPWPIQTSLHCEWWFQPTWLADYRVGADLYEWFFREPMEQPA